MVNRVHKMEIAKIQTKKHGKYRLVRVHFIGSILWSSHHDFFGNEQENMLVQELSACFLWKRAGKHACTGVVGMFFVETGGKTCFCKSFRHVFTGSEWKNMLLPGLPSCFSWKRVEKHACVEWASCYLKK